MLGARKPEQIQRNLSRLNKKGVTVVHDEVSRILPNEHRVETKTNSFQYDYLVLALGADYDYQSIRGFENAYHVYDLESAARLRDELPKFNGGKVAIGVSRTPFKCPAAPYEAALLIDHYLRNRRYVTRPPSPFSHQNPNRSPPLDPRSAGRFQHC
jgi:sulfide:quinone oxidoreductase